jgi:hypothetical protein
VAPDPEPHHGVGFPYTQGPVAEADAHGVDRSGGMHLLQAKARMVQRRKVA